MADIQAEHETGTDAGLLAAVLATVTALLAPCGGTGIDLSALADDEPARGCNQLRKG